MRDPTLTTDCPDCGVRAGETCLDTCGMEDFKKPSEVTVLEQENESLRRQLAEARDETLEECREVIRLDAALKDLQARYDTREKLWREYTILLIAELNEVVSLAAGHGWKSTRSEEGERLRAALADQQSKEPTDEAS